MIEKILNQKNISKERGLSVHDVGRGDYVNLNGSWKKITRIKNIKVNYNFYDIYVKSYKRGFKFWKKEEKHSCFEVRCFAKKK